MLRQAALAVPVAYRAISLRNCSDGCASRRPSRKRQSCLPARLSAGVSVLTEKNAYAPITASLPSLPDVKISAAGRVGAILPWCRVWQRLRFRPPLHRRCSLAVKPLFFFCLSAQGKAPVFLKTGALSKGAQPLYDFIWRFFRHLTPKLTAGQRRQKNRPKISPLPGE